MKYANLCFFALFLLLLLSFSACGGEDDSGETVAFVREVSPLVFSAEAIPLDTGDDASFFAQIAADGRLWSLWHEEAGLSLRIFAFGDTGLIAESMVPLPLKAEATLVGTSLLGEGIELFYSTGDAIVSQTFGPDGRVMPQTEEALVSLSGSERVRNIARLSDGTLVALLDSDLRWVDSETGNWGRSVDFQGQFWLLYGVANGQIYLGGGRHLYRFDIEHGILTRLIDWHATGVMMAPFWLVPMGGDVFFAYHLQGLYRLSPLEEQGEDMRTVLTLATSSFGAWDISPAVADFNRANEAYRIELLEIADDDLTRLQADLAIGQVPDILFYASSGDMFHRYIPSHRLAARGLLADLYAFIDADPVLSRESFLPNILEAASAGDYLFEFPHAFSLDVVAGDAGRLGAEMGWTFDEMLYILDETGFEGYLFGPNIDQHVLLWSMLSLLVDDFIDWDTGTAYFDFYAFQRLLETVKAFAPPVWEDFAGSSLELIQGGRQLLKLQTISSPNSLQFLDFYFEDMVLIGFPVSQGVGHSIRYEGSFSIAATSQHKDAAWSFVRGFFVPERFDAFVEQFGGPPMGMPVHVEAVEAWLSFAHPGGFSFGFGERGAPGFYEVMIDDATDYDRERVRTILPSVTRVSRSNSAMFDIVSEVAETYFRGDRTAEEAAAMIQNRVQIFIAEQHRAG